MISFIVPAWNEQENIAPTVETIVAAANESRLDRYEIILIDDGSTDGTPEAMAAVSKNRPFVRVLHNERNLGIGTSIRRGISEARHPRFMIVPGDNDMDKALIVLLLAFRDVADLVLTVPLNKEIRSLARNITSLVYQTIQMATFDVYVAYINGPGIWPTEKARAVNLEAERFSIICEMNVKLLRSGCSYAEVPGYFQAGRKARRTVTFSNLREVIRLYLRLVYGIHVGQRDKFSQRPRRMRIDFASVPNSAGSAERGAGVRNRVSA
jgi:dolichol-phosphate mannosyltransferase